MSFKLKRQEKVNKPHEERKWKTSFHCNFRSQSSTPSSQWSLVRCSMEESKLNLNFSPNQFGLRRCTEWESTVGRHDGLGWLPNFQANSSTLAKLTFWSSFSNRNTYSFLKKTHKFNSKWTWIQVFGFFFVYHEESKRLSNRII